MSDSGGGITPERLAYLIGDGFETSARAIDETADEIRKRDKETALTLGTISAQNARIEKQLSSLIAHLEHRDRDFETHKRSTVDQFAAIRKMMPNGAKPSAT